MQEWIHNDVWLARKVFVAVSAFILGYYALTYKDLSKVNNKMLQEMQQKITEIHAMEVTREQRMAIASDDNSSPHTASNCNKEIL